MDSLPQELLEAIIDYIPLGCMGPCALVGTRWRNRCQQRRFSAVQFSSELEVVNWCANIPQDPDGIPSYAKEVDFLCITRWIDPMLLGQVLKCFRRVETLSFFETEVPSSEVYKIVTSGEFGREITSLSLICPTSTAPALLQLILSFSKLRELKINSATPPVLFSVFPHEIWQRDPLQSLELSFLQKNYIDSIALCGVTSYEISLYVGDTTIEKIIAQSAEVMREFVVQDLFLPTPPTRTYQPPAKPLPTFSALTTMRVDICSGTLSSRLAGFLSCITSAPALTSITFNYSNSTPIEHIPDSGPWKVVDKLLARLSTHARTKSLTVVLVLWPEGNTEWEEYLPEFREAGGELQVVRGKC